MKMIDAENRADELVKQWQDGNRKAVVNEIVTYRRGPAALLVALIAARLNDRLARDNFAAYLAEAPANAELND